MSNTPKTPVRILTIAGSDSGGGAGIQADLKTITCLGGFGMSAITAITAQNTRGVDGVWPMTADCVAAQIHAILADIGLDGLKTGMLASSQHVETIAEIFAYAHPSCFVVDPVLVTSSGTRIADNKTLGAYGSLLFPIAGLITPNSVEAETLTGLSVEDINGQQRAANRLLEMGAKAALVKGGHVQGEEIEDVLHTQDQEIILRCKRIDSPHTHGTGCTMASAIATLWANGENLENAVRKAQTYIAGAIQNAPNFGDGPNGPMHHGFATSFESKL